MNENSPNPPCHARVEDPATVSRRGFLEKICVALGVVCGALIGLPVVGFILAPLFRKAPEKWVPIGKLENYVIGKTVSVSIVDPSSLPWAGISAKSAAWVRREGKEKFVAFSVNCTHLGCPVRWMGDAELFMCPCHGGVFYKDGRVAAGPPQHPLPRHQVRVVGGEVQLLSSPVAIQTDLS